MYWILFYRRRVASANGGFVDASNTISLQMYTFVSSTMNDRDKVGELSTAALPSQANRDFMQSHTNYGSYRIYACLNVLDCFMLKSWCFSNVTISTHSLVAMYVMHAAHVIIHSNINYLMSSLLFYCRNPCIEQVNNHEA